MKNFKKIIAIVHALVMITATFAACGGNESKEPAGDKIKVALICLHGDASTYDKNFIDAFKEACANKGLTEDDYTIVTDIPEDTACYDQAADLAENYDLIFADSFFANLLKVDIKELINEKNVNGFTHRLENSPPEDIDAINEMIVIIPIIPTALFIIPIQLIAISRESAANPPKNSVPSPDPDRLP